MTLTETTATSGAVLGVVVVLLLQQFGALPLSEIWPTALWFVLALLIGGVGFGALGRYYERR